jgi:hypothetical protein
MNNTTINVSSPITYNNHIIGIQAANLNQNGYLSSTQYSWLYRENNCVTLSNNTTTIDWSISAKYIMNMTTDLTLTLSNVTVGEMCLYLVSSGNILTFPNNWLINGEVVSSVNVISFQYYDNNHKVINIAPYV